MNDYIEIMKDLFLKDYSPDGLPEDKENMTTDYIFKMFQGIIPQYPIDEHDVYNMLSDLGFKQELVILYEEVCIVKENKKKGIKAEYDKIETGRMYKWIIFAK
ncbi:hypothetical protein HZP84_04110 [Elizabethkingia anophelis]|uniref:hypothetical protein n=1 Tax=Elizabethkingia meningoseptica TaxID=238 RepID=UPI0018C325CB|nr:hypothetical protein [Elizabethkingia meningoseptica]MBG0515298.1 hypothetical protein [Elizabethkingia meningoseptica]MCT4079314.1 hypothetical protein [Elizabethkingia anophelis]